MIAVGLAQDKVATCTYHEEAFAGGLAVSSFCFGHAVAEGAIARPTQPIEQRSLMDRIKSA
jgi:hypothetical protein